VGGADTHCIYSKNLWLLLWVDADYFFRESKAVQTLPQFYFITVCQRASCHDMHPAKEA